VTKLRGAILSFSKKIVILTRRLGALRLAQGCATRRLNSPFDYAAARRAQGDKAARRAQGDKAARRNSQLL
jgi:hypothetical protein